MSWIPKAFRMLPGPLSVRIVETVVIVSALLVGYIFMFRSFAGFQMQVAGFAKDASR